MTDFWSTPRLRVLKGDILANGGVGCDVHNGSRTGATLRVSGASGLPSAFVLQLAGGPTLTCAVIRRSRIELGVRFVG